MGYMTKREEHIATARIRHAAGESVDQLCYRMRADGLSKMDCIAVLHDVLGRKTGEVMRLVHHSSTWTDRRAADERTEATLIEFLKPLEGRSVSLDEMMPLLESGWL